jgi:cellulose synthase/poly-beta-1,6-N-acetylglucosamine synthase-like glycosyltransferase
MDLSYILGFYMLAALFSYALLLMLSYRSTPLDAIKEDRNVSLIAPATDNDAAFIVAATKKFLALPLGQVIIVCDGSYQSFAALMNAFDLYDIPGTNVFESKDKRLMVIRKISAGSKGHAVNSSLDYVYFPYVFVVDADSVVSADTVNRCMTRIKQENADACGIPLRLVNGKGYWGFVQVGEFARAMTLRQGWANLGLLCNISGAAGLFRTSALQQVRYDDSTCAEDLHSTWSFHSRGYKVTYEETASIGHEAPSTYATCRSQRIRWHRGLHEALSLVPPRGEYAVLWTWLVIFEVLEVFIEVFGLCWLATHHVSSSGWWGLAGTLSFTISLTILSVLHRRKFDGLAGRQVLTVCLIAPLELAIFKPLNIWWRLLGSVAYFKGDRSWEAIPRALEAQSQS